MMAPHWKTSNINAAEALSRRSRGISGSLTRLNLKVLRDILVQGNRDFSEVCSKTSNSQIMYENGKIYLDSYVRCYTCVHSEPHLLYNLPKRCETAKFQDALLLQCPLENTLASPSDQKSSLLVLNDNNWLYRLSDATGQELERVFLSSKHRFKYLSWDVSQEIFYVKSVQIKDNTWPRQADIRQSIVAQLAIFQIFPLQIVGVMEVNKQVFGSGVTDVVLSQGLLVVSYSRAVKFFSFEHIVKKYMKERLALGMASTLLKGKKVGEFPFGIPVNIQITEQPPVLFEVPCSNTGLQIGGFPWHYIHTPPQKRHHGTHHICSLRDRTMPTSQVTVTSSGRAVKRRIQQLDDDPDLETFHMVEYEDELDLLAVVVTNGADGEGRARIQLHDNQSGRVLKTVDLSETWDETFRHDLVFDKDTIIHIEQKHTKVCCHVYKLQAADI
ncbi:DDB1- and CUL4-associated factor 17 isoform X2 [Nerophis ophidion]|uniref:DDB1- and CUL4-associated factor 17 isoform X2 n=1 Tax=Nerophis ophidion TaxID=159077 RepID=UPI002AE08EF8|nr:DDB1- and CUL4-associated factor 17 isoform X2 [Nerophis ophidion]